MALNFTLPTDPKQRQQILIAGVLGAVILIIVLVMFVVTPQREKQREKHDALTKLEQEIDQATHDTKNLTADRHANYDCLHGIMEDVISPYFIHSELGSYSLPAERILKKIISDAGIVRTNIVIQEIGPNDFMMTPEVLNDKTVICQSYTVMVTIKCGYNKLADIMALIQAANPYVAITSLRITDIPTEIRQHQITFQVQWPTWRTVDIQTKVQTDYKAALASTVKTPSVSTNVAAARTNAIASPSSNAVPDPLSINAASAESTGSVPVPADGEPSNTLASADATTQSTNTPPADTSIPSPSATAPDASGTPAPAGSAHE